MAVHPSFVRALIIIRNEHMLLMVEIVNTDTQCSSNAFYQASDSMDLVAGRLKIAEGVRYPVELNFLTSFLKAGDAFKLSRSCLVETSTHHF